MQSLSIANISLFQPGPETQLSKAAGQASSCSIFLSILRRCSWFPEKGGDEVLCGPHLTGTMDTWGWGVFSATDVPDRPLLLPWTNGPRRLSYLTKACNLLCQPLSQKENHWWKHKTSPGCPSSAFPSGVTQGLLDPGLETKKSPKIIPHPRGALWLCIPHSQSCSQPIIQACQDEEYMKTGTSQDSESVFGSLTFKD